MSSANLASSSPSTFVSGSSHEDGSSFVMLDESNSDEVTLLGGQRKINSQKSPFIVVKGSSGHTRNSNTPGLIGGLTRRHSSNSGIGFHYRLLWERIQYYTCRIQCFKMCFVGTLCILVVLTLSTVIDSSRVPHLLQSTDNIEISGNDNSDQSSQLPQNLSPRAFRAWEKTTNHIHKGVEETPERDFRLYPWTFRCVDNKCQRQLAQPNQEDSKVSFDICWLTCGASGSVWPKPGQAKLSQTTARFYPENFFIRDISGPTDYVKGLTSLAANLTRMEIKKLVEVHERSDRTGINHVTRSTRGNDEPRYSSPDNTIIEVHLAVSEDSTSLSETTDESYEMKISSVTMGTGALVNVNITGATYFGLRHGLETLSQLIAYDEIHHCLHIVDDVLVRDGPAYPIRGLMIDTARNFIPLDNLYRMVDAMSYNKMNTLHWHLTDSNSFPFRSVQVPQMSVYGAYAPDKVYTIDDIKSLVFYALVRGVKIIPELDAPAHAGNGWQWGPAEGLGELAVCIGVEPWRHFCGQPPCGQLNPINEHVYDILQKLYEDLLEAFNVDLFHLGGDEVVETCWNSIPGMREFMNHHRFPTYKETWGYFHQQSYERLKAANKDKPIKAILWSSGLTSSSAGNQFLDPRNFAVQIWETSHSHQIGDLLRNGYKLIFSNVDAMYLDMGGGTWLGKEHVYTYHNWQKFYDNDLDRIVSGLSRGNSHQRSQFAKQVLGGIATLWSEKVDENNMDMKLWPRGSASAERLWSNPREGRDRDNSVYARLNHQTKRLKDRGIQCSTLQPESCLQMTGNCDDPQNAL